ncbi:hypothetical protein M902_2851 [Bacteriovorax sp. BAL6_X]|uniref:hypothetical protein n=1 Tax=Bacteriovorax sp. BAL6_X TaxID=1201290 RepID=UPI0003859FC7|nr:hypothetical protein [Bacteriovorax sp. BAL6_X]EPZ51036.1 hypothetical protein M902_2851 [Bacteriovorax sp. BAL6_X]
MHALVRFILLSLLCQYFIYGSKCSSVFSGRFLFCITEDGSKTFKNIIDHKKYKKIGQEWFECINEKCTPLLDEKKKLYFETTVGLSEKSDFDEAIEMEPLYIECSKPEALSLIKSKSTLSKVRDVNSILKNRIKEVKKERLYHLGYYDALISVIDTYDKNVKNVYNKKFIKSYAYNKVDHPLEYLIDLNSYKRDLINSKNEIEILLLAYDSVDFNIHFDLEKNKAVKELFDEFTEASGFPGNKEEIFKEIDRKLAEIEKEEESLQVILMDNKKADILEFERQLSENFRFKSVAEDMAFANIEKINTEVESLKKQGNIQDAYRRIAKFEEESNNLEGLLSLQVNSKSRQRTLKKIKLMNSEIASNFKKSLSEYIQENRKSLFQPRPNEVDIPSGGVASSSETNPDVLNDRARDQDHNSREETRVVINSATKEVFEVTLRDGQWMKKGSFGYIVGISNGSDAFLVSDGDIIHKIDIKDAFVFQNETTDFMRKGVDVTEFKIDNSFFEGVESNRLVLSRTPEGRDFLDNTLELKNEINLTSDLKVSKIKEARELIRPNDWKVDHGPVIGDNDPKGSDLKVSSVVIYTIYFGVSVTPVVSDIADLAEFVNMLISGKDFLGNDAASLDYVLTGLGALLPCVSGPMLRGLTTLIDYLKKGGVEALGKFLEVARKGDKFLENLFQGLIRGVDKKVNVLTDLSSTFWGFADDVIELANNAGLKTKEGMKSLFREVVEIVGNDIGAIGDNIANFTKSVEKYKQDIIKNHSGILQRVHKGMHSSVSDSLAYHVAKHGKGRSATEYVNVGLDFFNKNKNIAVKTIFKDGTEGYRIQTKYTNSLGKKVNRGGLFTKDGRLLSYWD